MVPVGCCGFGASRRTTVPRPPMTSSAWSFSASAWSAGTSGSKTTWMRPVASRISTKMSCPRSRRRWTHPVSTTSRFAAASPSVSVPHPAVRCMSRPASAAIRRPPLAQRGRETLARDVPLLTGLHVLEAERSPRDLRLADEEREPRAEALCALDLRAERARERRHHDRDPGRAKLPRERRHRLEAGVAERDEDDVRHGGRTRLVRHDHDDPLHPCGEAEAGDARAADLLDEAVVAPAADEGVLGAERPGDDLEDGALVVVEPPHEPRVDDVRDAVGIEAPPHRVEVRGALLRQMVDHARRPLETLPVGLDLAVEDAERVLD